MVLFINSCVRENSRTLKLAKSLIEKNKFDVVEVKTYTLDFPIVDEDFITKRDSLIANGRFDDDMFKLANQFAKADIIIIAAPIYDLSFPASLKQYIEQINVRGVTFAYTETGRMYSLCKCKKMYYISTTGGPHFTSEYGYGYIKALANQFYGVNDVELIYASGLDIYGANVDEILIETKKKYDI